MKYTSVTINMDVPLLVKKISRLMCKTRCSVISCFGLDSLVSAPGIILDAMLKMAGVDL